MGRQMPRRTLPDHEEFIACWNAASSVSEVAATFSGSKDWASQRACNLRKAGNSLKRFGRFYLTATCEDCGKEFRTFPSTLKVGRGRYCSRLCSDKHMSDNMKRHGDSRTRLHQIWCHMKTRCQCRTSHAFSYYGCRGIAVCREWQTSYEAFRDWAMSNGYQDGLEIDRCDTNGNYEPGNCRWSTRTEQMRNTRKRKNAQTSQYKGVSLHRSTGKWKVQVCNPGKPVHRGLFVSEIDAAKEYDRIVRIEFGEHAMTNFKEE